MSLKPTDKFQGRTNGTLKPKLPRKRKKACIKAQGRKSYYNTIQLARVTEEKLCKFWVNDSVTMQPTMHQNQVILIPTPSRFW